MCLYSKRGILLKKIKKKNQLFSDKIPNINLDQFRDNCYWADLVVSSCSASVGSVWFHLLLANMRCYLLAFMYQSGISLQTASDALATANAFLG